MPVPRRPLALGLSALLAAAAAAVVALSSCSGSNGAAYNPGAVCDAGTAGPASPAPDSMAGMRAACAFGADASTSDTIGGPTQDAGVLEHVVVLMLENRSFDHIFSDLPSVHVTADVAGPGTSNPDGDGGVVYRYPEPTNCEAAEPQHEWGDAHLSLAGGRMDGFVAATGDRSPMGYYTCHDLPFYYALAKSFAISDRHFCSLLGPTQPNHLFLLLGTSCGFAEGFETNVDITTDCGLTRRSILDVLRDNKIKHKVYDESFLASVIVLLGVDVAPSLISDFYDDADAGTLPTVSIIGGKTDSAAKLAPPEDDDHPPANVQDGQAFVKRIVDALTKSPSWSTTALFITYDEHGGYFDHVQPPAACDPDDTPPGQTRDYAFTQLGFRVPLILVSPFAKKAYVSHYDTDHTSIIRFIEHWQHLGALTARDANAWPFLDMFDFTQPTVLSPPALPSVPSDAGCAPVNAPCP
jgi:phospholipase C